MDGKTEVKFEVPPAITQALDPVLRKFYPYLFASIDYIIHGNMPRVIDVNGVANSFAYQTIPAGLDLTRLFKYFINKTLEIKNDEGLLAQALYQSSIFHLYQAVRKIGPAYISGERVVSLPDLTELKVNKILEENYM